MATITSIGLSSIWLAKQPFPPRLQNNRAPELFGPCPVIGVTGGVRGGLLISLTATLATPDGARRRTIGQILLLAAGFLVLVAISAASVLLVNKARGDFGL